MKPKLPLGLKLAAGYLLLGGLFGFSLFVFKFFPEYKEFAAKSIAYKVGSYSREIVFNLVSIISGWIVPQEDMGEKNGTGIFGNNHTVFC